jgi:hypothetical protein
MKAPLDLLRRFSLTDLTLDLFGGIVPSFLLWSVLAYVLARSVSKVVTRGELYRHVWHAARFDVALYVCVLASLVLVSKEFVS